MRRAFSSHWGGSGEGEEREAHALKTTETQVETALWEIRLSTNKAGSWKSLPDQPGSLGREIAL